MASSLYEQWMEWDTDPETRREMESLSPAEREAALTPRITFGTAGLRGTMRAGFANMNALVVQQTTQGLARYLVEQVPGTRERGVVLGCDHRHHSAEYLDLAARVLLREGVRVFAFRGVTCCTPFVPFELVRRGCVAGVMITASHNPKQDNGYKLYGANGSQIISPVDAHVSDSILRHLVPWRDLPAADAFPSDPLFSVISDFSFYFAHITAALHASPVPPSSPLRIVYTAMHGVGQRWIDMACASFGLPPFFAVEAQAFPDPDFPTVPFPNPEEGKGALALALRKADDTRADVVLANDPDADRLAVAERARPGFRIFTGNEIGIMLAAWALQTYRERHPDTPAARLLVGNSSVSSKMLCALARAEGLRYVETLTGFKWLGNRADALRLAEGLVPLFMFEEAIGFMLGDACLDKDGVRAGVVMAELAHWLYARGLTLQRYLDSLYEKYGYHANQNSYFFCYELRRMDAIFRELRGGKEAKDPGVAYPRACGEFAVKSVVDLQRGVDTGAADGKAALPAASRMLTFRFENGATVTVRGSGTEPKLKYYAEMVGKRGEADEQLRCVVAAIVKHWLKPEENDLHPPANE